MFDILNYDTLAEPALKTHIDRVGIKIYTKSSESTVYKRTPCAIITLKVE